MSGIFNGLQNLINSIKTIINAVKMGVQFIVNLFKALIELVRLLFNIVGNAITLIATLPPWLTAFAMCTLSVAVLYMLLGRQSGKSE